MQKIFIKVTEQLQRDIQGRSDDVQRDIERFFNRLKQIPNARAMPGDLHAGQPSNGLTPYWVGDPKKNNGLIGFRYDSKVHADVSLYVFFKAYGPSDFSGGDTKPMLDSLRRPAGCDESSLERYLDEVLNSNIPMAPRKPMLPEDIRGWLEPQAFEFAEDLDEFGFVVKETKKWRAAIAGEIRKSRGQAIHRLLENFYLNVESVISGWEVSRIIPGIPESAFFYRVDDTPPFLCKYQETEDAKTKRPIKVLTLIDIKSDLDVSDDETWLRKAIETFVLEERTFSDELRKAKAKNTKMFPLATTYPGFFLVDQADNTTRYYTKWLENIENEKVQEANLLMSEEESDIMRTLTSDAAAMPTFINGPAGSGKSTMLQYLFAHYWKLKVKASQSENGRFRGNPLFLTLSKDLLETSKKVVSDILYVFPGYIARKDEDIAAEIKPSFISFRDLLAMIIGEDECERMFPSHLEIDFETFRKLLSPGDNVGPAFASMHFGGKLGKKSVTPELCWHIIRSYVKGYSHLGYLTADDFRGLGGRKDDAFVDEEDYACVFKNVWPWYKRWTVDVNRNLDNPEKRYWDQQDLARAALAQLERGRQNLPSTLKEVAAVFCDEAQDLTGVELRLVQKISIFSEYDLGEIRNPSLPFAFAADPMQTLNPSGFRWQNLKSSLFTNLIEPLGGRAAGNGMETMTLTLNYRSPRLVTYFANLVQLARKSLFGGGAKPQTPHLTEEGMPRFRWFDASAENPLSESELDSLAGSVVILPCSEGWEQETIDNAPLLRQIQREVPNQVFLSVMSAKGLTFKNVVVYGFGHLLFQEPVPETMDGHNRNIALSYAMNKLYVAISRAAQNLIVVDSFQGRKNLWDIIGTAEYKEKCLAALSKSGQRGNFGEASLWKELLPEDVHAWECDDFASTLAILSFEDLAEQGTRLFKDAWMHGNHALMIQAGNFFAQAAEKTSEPRRAHSLKTQSEACLAYADEFCGRYEDAARKFDEITTFDDWNQAKKKGADEGTRCLWKGNCWKVLKDRARKGQFEVPARKAAISTFLASAATTMEARQFLSASDIAPNREDGDAFRQVGDHLQKWAKDVLLESETQWSDTVRSTVNMAIGYLSQHIDWFTRLRADLFRLSVRMAVLTGEESRWKTAKSLFRSEMAPGAERDWLLYRAHCGTGAEFVHACMKLKDFGLFLKRKDQDAVQFNPRRLDRETTGWIFSEFLGNQGKEAAVRFAVESGDLSGVKPEHLQDVPFPLKLQLAKALSQESEPDWERTKSILKRLIRQAEDAELDQLEDLFLVDPRIRKSPIGRDVADAVFERVERLFSRRRWPRDCDALARTAKLFEAFSKTDRDGQGNLLSLTTQKVGDVFRTRRRDLVKEASRGFLRAMRLEHDARVRNKQPAEDIKQKASQTLFQWGCPYSEQAWAEAANDLRTPPPLKPTAPGKIVLDELKKERKIAASRDNWDKVMELTARIQEMEKREQSGG